MGGTRRAWNSDNDKEKKAVREQQNNICKLMAIGETAHRFHNTKYKSMCDWKTEKLFGIYFISLNYEIERRWIAEVQKQNEAAV